MNYIKNGDYYDIRFTLTVFRDVQTGEGLGSNDIVTIELPFTSVGEMYTVNERRRPGSSRTKVNLDN